MIFGGIFDDVIDTLVNTPNKSKHQSTPSPNNSGTETPKGIFPNVSKTISGLFDKINSAYKDEISEGSRGVGNSSRITHKKLDAIIVNTGTSNTLLKEILKILKLTPTVSGVSKYENVDKNIVYPDVIEKEIERTKDVHHMHKAVITSLQNISETIKRVGLETNKSFKETIKELHTEKIIESDDTDKVEKSNKVENPKQNIFSKFKEAIKDKFSKSGVNVAETGTPNKTKNIDDLKEVAKKVFNKTTSEKSTTTATNKISTKTVDSTLSKKTDDIINDRKFIKSKSGGIVRVVGNTPNKSSNNIKENLNQISKNSNSILGNVEGTLAKDVGAAGASELVAPMVAEGVGAALLPALAVGAAGVAGYMVGDKVISPVIDNTVSAISGNKSKSFGDALYSMFGKDDYKNEPTILPKQNNQPQIDAVAPKQKISAADIDKINSATTPMQQGVQQPVIQQTSAPSMSPSGSGSGAKPQTAMPAIRNHESTFERVIMQDFWGKHQ